MIKESLTTPPPYCIMKAIDQSMVSLRVFCFFGLSLFMSCSSPFYSIKLPGINKATGKPYRKIVKAVGDEDYFYMCQKHGKDNVQMIPCGKCDNCKLDHAKTWALRCCLESLCYKQNTFLTLTYNEKCLPKFLDKKDIQKFIKRLRKEFCNDHIRYFLCSEYGSKTKRLHYHLILFGFWPDDAQFTCPASLGGNFYSSKRVQKCWPFGFVSVGEVSYNSCFYVARYCNKKIDDNLKGFILMSRKPGIGFPYFEKHQDIMLQYDAIFEKVGYQTKSLMPRYFDNLLEILHPDDFGDLKRARLSKQYDAAIANVMAHNMINYNQYLSYKKSIEDNKSKKYKKGVF